MEAVRWNGSGESRDKLIVSDSSASQSDLSVPIDVVATPADSDRNYLGDGYDGLLRQVAGASQVPSSSESQVPSSSEGGLPAGL